MFEKNNKKKKKMKQNKLYLLSQFHVFLLNIHFQIYLFCCQKAQIYSALSNFWIYRDYEKNKKKNTFSLI